MPANFALATKFTAIDKVSGAFKNMSKNADKFGNRADKAFRKASRSGERFRDITKGILAAGAISRGVGLLERGVAAATVEFVNFDQAVTSASAKFKGLNLATKEGQRTLARLKKSARDVGAVTQFSATQAAQGLDFLALAGFNAEQSMAALPGVVDLATVANVDLGTATDIASDALGAFGLMTKDSIQLQKNLTRVNDVFAKTTATANTNLTDLFEAVKKGGPEFVQASQSIETFSAMAGFMANAGIKGEEAGTQLRNAIMRLTAPTSASGKVLQQLGVNVSDSNGNVRDAIDIFADLQKGLNKVKGNTQRAAFATEIFGARSAGLKVLLGANIDELRKYRSELKDAGGAAKNMADIMRTSLLNRLKGLQSALIELTFKVFTRFKKRGGAAIDAITEAVRKFDPAPIIVGIEKIIIAFKLMGSLITILKPLIAGILAYKAALLVAALAQKSLTAASLIYIGFVKAQIFFTLAKSIGFAGTAMTLLNAAMAANPIGVIIAGVVALGTALYLVVKHWDDIVDAIKTAVDLSAKFLGFSDEAQAGPIGGAPVSSSRTEFVTPPNKADAEARAQQFNFMGRLDITGAPPGSTFEHTGKGAPRIEVELLGVQ